jgi:hypothetical protein
VSPPFPNPRIRLQPFLPKTDDSLDGIIAHLTRCYGGNLHDRGIIEVTAKSVSSKWLPKNTADLQSTVIFHSRDEPGQWLCYDFKERRVRPTHYSIHSYPDNLYLRSWVFEGSLDNSTWVLLDDQKGNTTMDASHPIGTFAVAQSSDCRFVRLRQTGKNAKGDDYLLLYAFEIFGQLIDLPRTAF